MNYLEARRALHDLGRYELPPQDWPSKFGNRDKYRSNTLRKL